jgi:hypothetical protein
MPSSGHATIGVGLGVGLGVGRRVGRGVGLGDGEGDALGLADGDAMAIGSAVAIAKRTPMTMAATATVAAMTWFRRSLRIAMSRWGMGSSYVTASR